MKEAPSNPSDMGEMGLILDRHYKKQAILKKASQTLPEEWIRNNFSAHPPTIPCFICVWLAPDGLRSPEGKAKEPTRCLCPARMGARNVRAPRSRRGIRSGWEPGSLVWRPLQMELPSPGPNFPGGVLRWQDSVRLASRAVRRIWLPVHGALTTHKGLNYESPWWWPPFSLWKPESITSLLRPRG